MFREFADDRELEPSVIGKDQVLVVVAAGRDALFEKVSWCATFRARRVQVLVCRAVSDERAISEDPRSKCPFES